VYGYDVWVNAFTHTDVCSRTVVTDGCSRTVRLFACALAAYGSHPSILLPCSSVSIV
jgi:hypothetical protein